MQISEEAQSSPLQQHEFFLQQEEEQTEPLEVVNEASIPPATCQAIVIYKKTFLIEFLEYVKTTWKPVTLQTLTFRHLAKTEMQQSLWEEEKKKLKKKIEEQKLEIQELKEKMDEILKVTG